MKSHDIRAVFFDVDGTLTSFTTHEVPASTITALQRLRECGVLVFICTGRAPSQFEVVARMLPVEFDREHQVYAWISGDRVAQALTSA